MSEFRQGPSHAQFDEAMRLLGVEAAPGFALTEVEIKGGLITATYAALSRVGHSGGTEITVSEVGAPCACPSGFEVEEQNRSFATLEAFAAMYDDWPRLDQQKFRDWLAVRYAAPEIQINCTEGVTVAPRTPAHLRDLL